MRIFTAKLRIILTMFANFLLLTAADKEDTCTIKFEEVSVVKQVPTYKKHCTMIEDTKCKTVFKNAFTTSLETQCEPTFETKCDPVIQTAYEQQCKQIIDKECRIVNVEEMGQHHEKTICQEVPKEKCVPVPVKIEAEKCVNVPVQSCMNVPVTTPVEVPKQECWKKPRKVCQTLVTLKPKIITEKIPKEVCDHALKATKFPFNKKQFANIGSGFKQERATPSPSPPSTFPATQPSKAQVVNPVQSNSFDFKNNQEQQVRGRFPKQLLKQNNQKAPLLNPSPSLPQMPQLPNLINQQNKGFKPFQSVNRYGNLNNGTEDVQYANNVQYTEDGNIKMYGAEQAEYDTSENNVYSKPQPLYESSDNYEQNPNAYIEMPNKNNEQIQNVYEQIPNPYEQNDNSYNQNPNSYNKNQLSNQPANTFNPNPAFPTNTEVNAYGVDEDTFGEFTEEEDMFAREAPVGQYLQQFSQVKNNKQQKQQKQQQQQQQLIRQQQFPPTQQPIYNNQPPSYTSPPQRIPEYGFEGEDEYYDFYDTREYQGQGFARRNSGSSKNMTPEKNSSETKKNGNPRKRGPKKGLLAPLFANFSDMKNQVETFIDFKRLI